MGSTFALLSCSLVGSCLSFPLLHVSSAFIPFLLAGLGRGIQTPGWEPPPPPKVPLIPSAWPLIVLIHLSCHHAQGHCLLQLPEGLAG